MKKPEALHKRHVRIYKCLRAVVKPLFGWLFALESSPLPDTLESPFLLVSNHTTNYDPIFASISSPAHMYFVSSEHVLRTGLGAWLLRNLFAPLARQKGTTDAAAAMAILRKLRAGANVCLFAEGNRSFNGRSGPIFPATGKMVKAAGCSLVTFKIEGGYFSEPRWGTSLRRGRMRACPVRVYTPQQIAAMQPGEVNAAIEADLFEDAYAREREEKALFRGRKLAEKLETALFVCPGCEKLGTLQSRGRRFFCGCGLQATYGEDGLLTGAPFASVTEWDDWQQGMLPGFVQGEARICADAGVTLKRLEGRRMRTEACGRVELYPYKLCVGGKSFPLREISDMAIAGRSRILFTWQAKQYEISGAKDFCGRKYLLFYRCLRGRAF